MDSYILKHYKRTKLARSGGNHSIKIRMVVPLHPVPFRKAYRAYTRGRQ